MNSFTFLIAAGAVAATVTVAPAATAREACEQSLGPCTGHVAVAVSSDVGTGGTSPYAIPLVALGGRTLAQYLVDHNETRMVIGW
jgi:hypothetical protein